MQTGGFHENSQAMTMEANVVTWPFFLSIFCCVSSEYFEQVSVVCSSSFGRPFGWDLESDTGRFRRLRRADTI